MRLSRRTLTRDNETGRHRAAGNGIYNASRSALLLSQAHARSQVESDDLRDGDLVLLIAFAQQAPKAQTFS